ncbi:DUF1801 domain-containing protein [Fodinibius halophilus]|uniref:DUF1801 domain-containing protein n=1 Tax=Fodinibius halophilus TaxID=1736908 RepID=A0A6M1T7K6_9BACT|nr:DUF1801 domain-containing protein [Fodinibius halophilus]NGP89375.1 DUF1801 domain-containing protein [Fodinibius halophilus]
MPIIRKVVNVLIKHFHYVFNKRPSEKLLEFMTPYPNHVQNKALGLRALVLRQAPNSFELIYDSYNALSTAFSFTSDLGNAFCHIALYSKHLNLGFNHGTALEDPDNLLNGSGKRTRHLKIKKDKDLETPYVQSFIEKAIAHINKRFPDVEPSSDAKVIVKSVFDNKRRPY